MKKSYLMVWLLLIGVQSLYSATLEDIEIHGYMSQGYLKSDTYNFLADRSSDGTFSWAEYGLNFSTQPTDRLRLGMQLFARDLGSQGNGEVKLDWAFGDYKFSDNFGLKIGKIFAPIGLHSGGRDIDMLRNSALLPQGVYSELFRMLSSYTGAEIYGEHEFSENSSLEYRVFKGSFDMESDARVLKELVLEMNGTPGSTSGEIENAWGGGFIWNAPIEGLRLGYSNLKQGVNIYYDLPAANAGGPFSAGKNHLYLDMDNWETFSLEYSWKKWMYTHETLEYRYNVYNQNTFLAERTETGYYDSAIYRLNDEYEIGIVRSIYYFDVNNGKKGEVTGADWLDYQIDLGFTLRWDIDDSWVMKFEYHDMEGVGHVREYEHINTSMNPAAPATTYTKKDWDMYVVKATFSF